MPRDPKYGIQISSQEITPADPSAVLYGVTPTNKFIPIKIDDEGRLELGAGLTLEVGDITIGDVGVTGVDPENGNAQEDIAVKNLGAGAGFAMRTALFNGSNQLAINPDGSLNVNAVISSGIPTTPINQFGNNLAVTPVAESTIVSYTVPVSKTLQLFSVITWGEYDGEYFVRVNGTAVGGGRTSAADRTLILPYKDAPITATSGQVVTVSVIHYGPHSYEFKGNILGGLS